VKKDALEITQHGYIVLGDISGFTSYLTKVELDHANAILTDLLEAIVDGFKTLLTLCKLEGDAVLAYAPESNIFRGETLIELFESTYALFRDEVEATRRRTTCTCRACQAIPSLDLKFFVHSGDYIVQNISGVRELVGSDVNLIHRLMKNHITEATGWTAYILVTAAALDDLGTRPQDLHAQIETYEHLGDIQTYSLNLRARYEETVAARRVTVGRREAHAVTSYDFPIPPPIIWEWLNDPAKRGLYGLHAEQSFLPVVLPSGRRGLGARTHCIHGKDVAMIETVLDWRPFDYFTVDQSLPYRLIVRGTYQLTPIPTGTRLEIYERGRGTPLALPGRLTTFVVFKKVFPTIKVLQNLEKCILQDIEKRRGPGSTMEVAGLPEASNRGG
jgi:class 3 adenylate cyclase